MAYKISIFDNSLCSRIMDSVKIVETGLNGEAELHVHSPSNCIFNFRAESRDGSTYIRYLKSNHVPDGIVFDVINTENCYVHIVELKRTATAYEVEHARLQFSNGMQYAKALASIMEMNVINFFFHIGYINENLRDETPNTIKYKATTAAMSGTRKAVYFDGHRIWRDSEITFPYPEARTYSLNKIRLNEANRNGVVWGIGELNLSKFREG